MLTSLRNFCSCSVAQSCLTPCNPMDCSPPGSSVHGILQARILEWVAMFSSRGSSQCRDRTHDSGIAGGFFTTEPPGKPALRNRERFYILIKVFHFFLFCKVSKQPYLASGNSVTRPGVPKVMSPWPSFKTQTATKEYGGEERQMQRITQMKSEGNKLCLALWRTSLATSVCQQ